jgi:hypothetical protein
MQPATYPAQLHHSFALEEVLLSGVKDASRFRRSPSAPSASNFELKETQPHVDGAFL